MASRATIGIGLLAGVVALLAQVATERGLASSMVSGEQRQREEQNREKRQHFRELYRGLARYAKEHGELPSSPEGPDNALYALRPFLRIVRSLEFCAMTETGHYSWRRTLEVSVLDVPHTLLDNGPASWDVVGRRAMATDIDYLNRPLKLDRDQPSFAVYAEKVGSSSGGRWVVFSNGAMLWVSLQNPEYGAVLGKSLAQLREAEAPGTGPPAERNSTELWGTWVCHGANLWTVLMLHAEDHGAIPYSVDGPDHALYAMRHYVPDAACFDLVYGRLENGTAYWDDAAGCLRNGDVDYINRPIKFAGGKGGQMALGLEEDVVVMATKLGVYGARMVWGGRSPFPELIYRGSPHFAEPLGES